MHSNLLSLQQTAKLQDLTQNRLATGLKVNSAIDNPSSYYTAQSLNNRAEDLNILLDAMSQGIQTLKAVNESIEAGTKFLEQAKSVASSALETAQPVIAKVSTEAELLAAVNSGKKGLIVLTSDITMSTNQNIVLNDGQSLVGARYLDKNAAQTKITFEFDSTSAAIGIEVGDNSLISDLSIDYTTKHKTDSVNFGTVRNNGHQNVIIKNINILFKTDDTSGNRSGALINLNNATTTLDGTIDINIPSTTGRFAFGLHNQNGGTFIQKETSKISITTNGYAGRAISQGDNIFKGIINIKTTGEWAHAFYGNATISGKAIIETSKSNAYGFIDWEVNLTSENAEIFFTENMTATMERTKFSAVRGATIMTKNGRYQVVENIKKDNFNETNLTENEFVRIGNYSADVIDKIIHPELLEKRNENNSNINQYNQILTQYDMLINDSWYKGVNLLKSQDLKVVFNESRTSDLDIKGVDATTKGLGLETADWSSADGVQNSLDQIDSAINQLRLYASEFGNYYQIVTTRENFTNSLINVLTEGADALTLADMNQESANMLALQTRQQLAVNSLSLASQASQSVLKLF